MTPSSTTLPSALCICGDPQCAVPYGYCHCLCGGKTNIATETDRPQFKVKGMPVRYIRKHANRKTNEYLVGEDAVVLAIDGVPETIFDRDDIGEVSKHHWCRCADGYFSTTDRDERGKQILLHRLICRTPLGMDTDHISGIKSDNRKTNLRPATRSQNMFNAGLRSTNTSGHRGVTWYPQQQKWRVRIWANKICTHIGMYDTKEEAMDAYRQAARERHGEFSRVNQKERHHLGG